MKRLMCWLAGIGVVTFILDVLVVHLWVASRPPDFDYVDLGWLDVGLFLLVLLLGVASWVLLYGSAVLGAIDSARRGHLGRLLGYVLAIPVVFLALPAVVTMILGSDDYRLFLFGADPCVFLLFAILYPAEPAAEIRADQRPLGGEHDAHEPVINSSATLLHSRHGLSAQPI